MTIESLKGPQDVGSLQATLNQLIEQINAMDGGVFNTSIRSTADGEAVLPASADAGFEITSNYAGSGAVDFWNLVNNDDVDQQGFIFRQKTGAGTSKTLLSFYSTTTFVEFDFLADNIGLLSLYIDATEKAIYTADNVPFNVYVGTGTLADVLALEITPAGRFVLPVSVTPTSAAAAGVAGTIAWDASFIYVCTATNTWKRVAIATW